MCPQGQGGWGVGVGRGQKARGGAADSETLGPLHTSVFPPVWQGEYLPATRAPNKSLGHRGDKQSLQGRKPGECIAPAHDVTPLWMLVGSWESIGERPCVLDLPGVGCKA